MRKLIIEDESGHSGFELVEEVTTIGRDASCDLVLSSNGISRRHIKITKVGENLLAEDLGSSNGTEINGSPLQSSTTLGRGDVLTLGDVLLHIDEVVEGASGNRAESSRENRRRADARQKKSKVPQAIAIALIFAVLGWMFRPDSLRQAADDSANGGQQAQANSNSRLGADSLDLDRDGENLKRRTSPLSPEERRQTQQRIQRLKTVKLEVESHLVQEDYLAAQQTLKNFETREGGRVFSLRRVIANKMKAGAAAIRAEFESQRRAGRAEYARGYLVENMKQFPEGSEARTSLESFLQGSDLVARADTTRHEARSADNSNSGLSGNRNRTPNTGPATAIGKTETAKTPRPLAGGNASEAFTKLRPQAAQAFKTRDYAGAAILYGTMVDQVSAANISSHEANTIKRQMRLAKVLHRMQYTITTLVNAEPATFSAIPLGKGQRASCAQFADEKFLFRQGEKELERTWGELSNETILALISKSKPEGSDAIDAGVFALMCGKTARGHNLIRRGEKNLKSLKDKVQQALADAMGIEKPNQGFVWIGGEYLTARNVARVDARATIEKNVPLLANSDPDKRKEAYLVLRSMGPRAASSFHRGLLEAKTTLLKKLESQGSYQKLVKLAGMRSELENLRIHALELIFDEYEYPYPYNTGGDKAARHSKANSEIKKRVKPIRELWEATTKASIGADFRKSIEILSEYNTQLDDIGIGRGTADPVFLNFLPATGDVTLQTFANSEAERVRIDTSILSMAKNEEKESIAKKIERQQVKITNEYRLLMGRQAVQMNDRLLEGARMHSQDMSDQGFFAHENPTVKEKRTPSDRMRWVGFYGSGASENIYGGGSDPRSAHQGWITSSGHHRNILGRGWRLLGSGQAGRNWTQNFARSEYSDAERERRGLPKGGMRTLQSKN